MCTNFPTCTQHTQQNPREPLQPYPVPTLPWQLVSQDHYSDYYEVDHLPTTQSTATKQHFGRHGVPHTLISQWATVHFGSYQGFHSEV